eukprot:Gb_31914 [translate_table: standard]
MQGPIRGIQSSRNREQRMQKYLKPGALAQLRDARISARSQSFLAARRCFIVPNTEQGIPNVSARVTLLSQPQASIIEETPCFKVRSFGPCYPQRKKLVASKAFIMAITQSTPSSPTGSGLVEARSDLVLETLPVDILAVH